MGEPVIINDGSPVQVKWYGDDGWKLDPGELSIVREGDLKLKWIMFNLNIFERVNVDGELQMKINFRLRSEDADRTLLVTTDRDQKNLRLAIANPDQKRFLDYFTPPDGKDICNKYQTPEDASITRITYQIDGGNERQGHTLQHFPTSIYFELAEADE